MSYGYFVDSEKEYVITEMYPKRPLMNYLWNETVMTDIDQFGFGTCDVFDGARRGRKLINEGDNRQVYIFDREDGSFYSANRNYGKLPFSERITHVGQGYSLIVSEYNGVRVEYKIFVPIEGRMECWEIKVKNTSDKAKRLSVYPYAHVNSCVSGHQAYVRAEYDEKVGGLISREEGYDMPNDYVDCFFASNVPCDEWDVASYNFIGVYNGVQSPLALENGGKLSCLGTSFVPDCTFVYRFNLDLAAGEEKVIKIAVGAATSVDDAAASVKRILADGEFEKNLAELHARANMYDDKLMIDTGDETVNRFANIWLKRQIDFGKTWARGYCVGSRDTMQDITSFVSLDSVVSREKLIYCMQFVRPNGNIMRAFVPILRNLSHDCSTWMITAVTQYIKESGDFSILDVDCPYFECDEHGTVLDHLMRASSFLLDGVGEHGLTLWGECDWNDSLNACGSRGKGESVWLSEATVKCSLELIELLEKLGQNDVADTLRAKREKMIANILKYGWEKDHFIYGINDFGEKIGSYDAPDAHAYLNSQTWAVLSGVLGEKELNALMDYVEDNLSCDFGYVQVSPCHVIGTDHIGRSSYFQKGCYENGSVYNHGCAFKIVADCYLKRGNEALKAVKMMLPTNPKNDSTVSGMEPYAISNMYLGPENEHRPGYSPMHWITGTCGWLLRGIVEYMLGVQASYDGLTVNPALPEEWKTATVHRTYRKSVYDITYIQNSYNGKLSVTVDGKAIEGNVLPQFEDGVAHKVVVNIG